MSAIKTNQQRAKIIYGICIATTPAPSLAVRGLEGGPVYSVDADGLRALVSDTTSLRVRPERRNIKAHQSVLDAAMNEATVLPMRFGVIAKNGDAVRGLLAANQNAINEQLERVDGRMEMGLRVSWDVANIYEYFVANHPMLREERDEVWAQGARGNRDRKIDLGRLYESLRSEERSSSTGKVKEVLLDGYCEEIVENPLKRENDVMNLACLIDRQAIDQFEKGVFEASKRFDNIYLFDYTGPWAPHNFVTLDLKTPTRTKQKSAGI
jgi:hypothetical protein